MKASLFSNKSFGVLPANSSYLWRPSPKCARLRLQTATDNKGEHVGLLDDLEPKPVIHSCIVRRTIASLEASDQTILEEAVADSTRWSSAALSSALKEKGISINRTSLTDHRKGACSCSKI